MTDGDERFAARQLFEGTLQALGHRVECLGDTSDLVIVPDLHALLEVAV